MSTSRSVLFISENKSPFVKTIQRVIKEANHPKIKPRRIKKGQFKDEDPSVMYSGGIVFPEGTGLDYFDNNNELIDLKNPKYKKLKLWADIGSCSRTFGKNRSFYNYDLFYKILNALAREHNFYDNDVLLLCVTTSGGYVHKSYPGFRKQWTGQFF